MRELRPPCRSVHSDSSNINCLVSIDKKEEKTRREKLMIHFNTKLLGIPSTAIANYQLPKISTSFSQYAFGGLQLPRFRKFATSEDL